MQETISTSDTPKRRPRRSYSKEFKAQVVAECLGEKSIAQVALEHQINANLVHKWSRQHSQGDHQSMVPVAIPRDLALTVDGNRIDVLIGEVTVRFVGAVDSQNARSVLEALR